MALKGQSITVTGAGVGGLAAAIALAQRGAEVTVLEQAEAITEVGAGLQISPNGLVVLDALGLGQAVRAAGIRARSVVLKDYRRAGAVARLDLDQHAADLTYLFVHRAALIDILAAAAREAGVHVRLLQKVTSVTPGRPVRIEMATGAAMAADLVVAADGLKSVARTALNGADRPFFTGQVAWRALCRLPEGRAPEVHVHMAPHRHLVSYPLVGDRLNLVAVQERAAWTADGWTHTDSPANLTNAFSDFSDDLRAVLEQVDAVHLWGLFRYPVATKWHAGGVVLLGDAAHPTLPFLAQGANMALEDAWVLADCLDRMAGSNALEQYQARRSPRVRCVISAANRNAWKYHLAFPPARWIGHLGLHLAGRVMPARLVRQFDWLYRHDVTSDP
ncbi:MAG: FAD-dependent monooxygenase [Pseudomonadota bacterium]